VPYKPGDTKAAGRRELVGAEGALGSGGGHWTRNIAFSPDGAHFYVSVGSAGNIDEERAPRATVQEFKADGSGQRTFASGLRNPVGIAFYPGTSDLYVVVNERDGLGDGLVPDYLTRLKDGGFYGWPYAYIGPHPQPDYAQRRPDLVKATIVPDVLFQSHSAPLGLVFYEGAQFPAAYRGGAFVALHGSWNSGKPTGYKVVFVPFKDGKPAGAPEDFLTGFLPDPKSGVAYGRPVGVAVDAKGALLVADDVGNIVWRIAPKP
jgi:glucose/arabinose dehydrogenase